MISAAAAMFSGPRNPLPRVSSLYDFGKHHNAQTGSSNNSETETDTEGVRLQKTAPRANFRFWVLFLLPVCT